MTQKIKTIIIALIFFLSVLSIATAFSAGTAFAQNTPPQTGPCAALNNPQNCGNGATPVVGDGCAGNTETTCLKKNPITNDIQIVVDALSAGVGVVVVGAIVLGGIQYSIAGDNPQAVGAAKKRITDALIALIAFMLIFAFLQWLIPGGIFG